MQEEKVVFSSAELSLEGLLHVGSKENGVVVTHPHPLYGGEMRNSVVSSVVHAYQEAGYWTLRFNFRGVGRSEGHYEDGLGEQEDVKSALQHLSGKGLGHIELAGYSFGAWVNAAGLDRYPVIDRLVMVSPPLAFLDFSTLDCRSKIALVISGSEDDIAPPHLIQEWLAKWNPDAELRIIEGADHFYRGKEETITRMTFGFLVKERTAGN